MSGETIVTNTGSSQLAIEAAAAEWLIARLHERDWGADRQAQLDAWLAESVAHEVAYLRLEAGWIGADRLAVLRTPAHTAPTGQKTRFRFKKRHGAVAIFLCALLTVSGYMIVERPQDKTFATSIGSRKTIALADGSRIDLNTDTELRLSPGSRHATLVRGEAYFRIVHNSLNPFDLNAGTHRIVDLGTEFVVRQKSDRLEVAVVEGQARVESAANASDLQAVVLNRGDVAIATRDRLAVTKKLPNILEDALSWRKGFVVFHHVTLGEAADEINRYNTEKIIIADKNTAARVFGGKFRTNDAERFANVVSAALALQAERRGNEIVISR